MSSTVSSMWMTFCISETQERERTGLSLLDLTQKGMLLICGSSTCPPFWQWHLCVVTGCHLHDPSRASGMYCLIPHAHLKANPYCIHSTYVGCSNPFEGWHFPGKEILNCFLPLTLQIVNHAKLWPMIEQFSNTCHVFLKVGSLQNYDAHAML